MTAPVYFYYGLTNFYQNHRKYLKSRDADQLAGTIKGAGDLSGCDPIIYNSDVGPNLTSYANKSLILNPDDVANPCGLVAKSYFTGKKEYNFRILDTYELYVNGQNVIDETGIAWQSDIDNKFKKPYNSENIQWMDVTNGKVYR